MAKAEWVDKGSLLNRPGGLLGGWVLKSREKKVGQCKRNPLV